MEASDVQAYRMEVTLSPQAHKDLGDPAGNGVVKRASGIGIYPHNNPTWPKQKIKLKKAGLPIPTVSSNLELFKNIVDYTKQRQ
jgi:hypothetical protein